MDKIGFILNPGTEPVAGATEEHAAANMKQFVADVAAEHGVTYDIRRTPDADDGDGRLAFELVADGQKHTIDMPGIPLDEVRYLDLEGQNIWDFPRLYVDGSSWVWKYAVNVCTTEDDR